VSEERWEVPQTWEWAAAGEIARIVGGGTPSSRVEENFAESGIPWITPADLTGYRSSHISRGRRDLSEQGFAGSGAQKIPAGSVLFSSRAPIGYCVVASNEVSTNQGFKSLVLKGEIVPEYVRHYLISAKDYAESKASGTTFMELSGARVAELEVPIAPLPEQRRIVAKVDGLTARTARARGELNRIPTLIARHKQRLLALAFSGELTAGWRTQNGIELGKEVALGDVATSFNYGTAAKSSPSGKVPVLRMGNIQDGKLDWTNLVYTSDKAEIDKYRLTDGDVLFNRTNSPELVGKTALFKGEREAVFAGYLIRIRCSDALLPAFLSYSLNSPAGRAYCWDVKTDGVSQSNINAKKIAAFRLLLLSINEQAEIVRRIESAFGWLDRMAADHAAAARLLPKLDAAILSKAFRGELVPQDPNDEPASVLLERIKAEREAEDGKPKRKGKPPKVHHLQAGSVSTGPPQVGTQTLTVNRTNPKRPSMSKSRQDDDVKDKPYLAGILKGASRHDVQTLFRAADLPVADFYKQLAWEIGAKHIIDDTKELKAA
jgi:type I restriction enzyme, S subunit